MKLNKSFIKSKTLWVALITVISGFFPDVQDYITKNPKEYTEILGVLMAALRFITKSELVAVKGDDDLLE